MRSLTTEIHIAGLDRREFALRFLQWAALLALPASAFSADEMPAAGPFDVLVLRDQRVRMRDGVNLATDVYLPARGAERISTPQPTLLERTPYGKSQDGTRHASTAVARLFASRGYAVVFQDCRGRGKSEGAYVKYLSDGADGFDCCAWIIEQSWCNGAIGTMGLSYAAHTQGALASAGAPGVKAMFMDSGGFSNAYQGGIRQGGAFELKQVTWAFNEALDAPDVKADPSVLAAMKATDLAAWFARMPWRRGHSPLSPVPDYESYVFDQWEHGRFDAYWKQIGIYAAGYYEQYCDAATVLISSWYDPYPRTVTDNFRALTARKRGPIHMILGPWTHGNREQTYAGDVDFGPASSFNENVAPNYLTLKLRWFDRFLKGERNGIELDAPVRLFVMGGGSGRRTAQGRLDHGGSWRTEQTWPLPTERATPYYLQPDGSLASQLPPGHAAPRQYRYDPAAPVPTIGGTITSGQPIMVGGAFDQREAGAFFGCRAPYRALDRRSDVLVFMTPPLAADLELTGTISAELWIASDAPDTDFTIKLIDVYPPNADYPNGYAMNLTDGILRCRYRDSWEAPTLMRAGQIYRIRIDAFPTSNLFKAGHRVRLDISSSNFPHFDLNSNTGEPEGKATHWRIATNRVFLDRDHPSHVILPVIPTLSGSALES
ncbi:MAG: CocE/NonD family hydrolase [Steroidobacteraceae bacterium]|jgi:putative CocE/NonD family hydrolase